MTREFSISRLNSNKGTKSDIEIALAERALDRFSSCFFEARGAEVGYSRVVATGDKLLAGAISQQALKDDRGAPASSRQRLGGGNISSATTCGMQWESTSQTWLLESS
jgi:hypothetical protein